ncbi:MAG: helix-turn-helix transcriptional regulator [Richelia sp. RM2_1_2]|nr:helix-turn-helix transcriptional regulator [Richelia sp. SM2_1_7]NJO64652.1 helix-turn-helix transcriptional regulator [Richelia sp. RM2_1_2]
MKKIEKFKEAKNRIRAIISKNLNKILEYLESKEFKPIDDENSQVVFQQTQEQLPVLVICDTKMLQPHDYSILTELSQNTGVAIISSKSPTNKAIKDKPLTNILKAKKLLRKIVARLERQINYEQESAAKIQKGLEIHPDETVKPLVAKSIFPFIPELNDIFDFIEAHYHEPIGLHEVAQSVGYSAAYLTDLVRRKTGHSVHRWITKRRMVAACSLLLETDKSIDCIAEAVGYRNSWCFFRLFRKSFGMTPGVWRSEARNSVGKTYNI